MTIQQCALGLDARGDAGILGYSKQVKPVDRVILARFAELRGIRPGYGRSVSVFPLPGERIVILVALEDTDYTGRLWPYSTAYLMDGADYVRMGCDPFRLLRAMGGFDRLAATKHREKRELAEIPIERSGESREVFEVWGASGVVDSAVRAALITLAVRRLRCYLLLPDGLLPELRNDLAEAVLLTLPLRERCRFSFTTCLLSPEEKRKELVDQYVSSCGESWPELLQANWCLVPMPRAEGGDSKCSFQSPSSEPRFDMSCAEVSLSTFKFHPFASKAAELLDRADSRALGELLHYADDRKDIPLDRIASEWRPGLKFRSDTPTPELMQGVQGALTGAKDTEIPSLNRDILLLADRLQTEDDGDLADQMARLIFDYAGRSPAGEAAGAALAAAIAVRLAGSKPHAHELLMQYGDREGIRPKLDNSLRGSWVLRDRIRQLADKAGGASDRTLADEVLFWIRHLPDELGLQHRSADTIATALSAYPGVLVRAAKGLTDVALGRAGNG